MKQEDVLKSSAWKMLAWMKNQKIEELRYCMEMVSLWIERAKNPEPNRDYKPTIHVGTKYDDIKDIEVKYDIGSLEGLANVIKNISKLEKEINELSCHQLYLIQADWDWADSRRSEAVFGVKEYE